MERKIDFKWIGVTFLVVIAIFFAGFFLVVKSNGQTSRLQSEIRQNEAETLSYQNKTKNLSVKKELQKMSDDGINVQSSLKEVTKKIQTAISLTYNVSETGSKSEYKQLSKALPKLVCKEFSSELIQLDKPVVNQSGKQTFPHGKTTDVLITFGKYNYSTTAVPVYIVVDYVSPELQDSNSKTIPGQDLFVLNYDIKKNSLKLEQYMKGATNNE